MTDNEKYLMHCSGLYTLIGWLREIQLSGLECVHLKNTITLHPVVARRFGIGFSRGKNTNNNAFFAIQSNEHKWMKLIKWDKVYIRENDCNIYLVSKQSPGDQSRYPDIPAFTIIIPIDFREKLQLFQDINKIEGRELTYNEDNKMKINFSSRLFNITVKHLAENEELPIPEASSFTRSDVISKNEAFAMSTQSNYAFVGNEKESNSTLLDYQAKLEEIKKKWL